MLLGKVSYLLKCCSEKVVREQISIAGEKRTVINHLKIHYKSIIVTFKMGVGLRQYYTQPCNMELLHMTLYKLSTRDYSLCLVTLPCL